MTALKELLPDTAGAESHLHEVKVHYEQAKEDYEQYPQIMASILAEQAVLLTTLQEMPEPGRATLEGRLRSDFRNRFVSLLKDGGFGRTGQQIAIEYHGASVMLQTAEKAFTEAQELAVVYAEMIDNPYCDPEKTPEQNRTLLDVRAAMLAALPPGTPAKPSLMLRIVEPNHPFVQAYDQGERAMIKDSFLFHQTQSTATASEGGRRMSSKQGFAFLTWRCDLVPEAIISGTTHLDNGAALPAWMVAVDTAEFQAAQLDRVNSLLVKLAKEFIAKPESTMTGAHNGALVLDTRTPEGEMAQAVLEGRWTIAQKVAYLCRYFEELT